MFGGSGRDLVCEVSLGRVRNKEVVTDIKICEERRQAEKRISCNNNHGPQMRIKDGRTIAS
ncbi:hypothetical protein SESBI_40353 [Sesbania bispinosa]|nr:hypothetical protein SESBI_40353 [Sesbania bispinosa]